MIKRMLLPAAGGAAAGAAILIATGVPAWIALTCGAAAIGITLLFVAGLSFLFEKI